jgi:hypothetical protein
MPLKPGVENISANIREMIKSGHPRKQAVAAAMRTARDASKTFRKGGGFVGSLSGSTPGRADAINLEVPHGAHVIPADIVAALGDGNSIHGRSVLFGLFPGSKPLKKGRKPRRPRMFANGGGIGNVSILASDGEFIVSPEDVARIGNGNPEVGHAILDRFIAETRRRNIDHLKTIPGPTK